MFNIKEEEEDYFRLNPVGIMHGMWRYMCRIFFSL